MTKVPSLASAIRGCARSGRRELLTSDLALRGGGAQGACTWGTVDGGHAAPRNHVPRSASDGSPFEQPDQEL
jgi:hypothetical protein